ncbi:hypothetical protein [Yersinia frederiksenii]|uniref:hypothetical protein n=1 Tax=Yersinia frederiksenii TaxID=29484 RepID=UPI0005EA4F2C|nr:hypothetical protein [Yersinia frederiksenii]CNG79095.1 Uncharacterised protein [Yersinia frederiksenii]CQI98040.1 Uncharacterised protein [Yersinia frederiksenii]
MTQEERIEALEQQVSEMKKQLTEIKQAVTRHQDSNQANFNDINAAISQAAIDSNVFTIFENAEANDGVITTKKSDGTISLRLTQTW